MGTYTNGELFNGAPTFTNNNDMSFYRNNGFWYLGSLASWPPVTYYRCVDSEGCNYAMDVPNTDGKSWTSNKRASKHPFPQFSTEPCRAAVDEL